MDQVSSCVAGLRIAVALPVPADLIGGTSSWLVRSACRTTRPAGRVGDCDSPRTGGCCGLHAARGSPTAMSAGMAFEHFIKDPLQIIALSGQLKNNEAGIGRPDFTPIGTY